MTRGSAGGRATVEKHGVDHMREIGRKGFESFTARYFQGDRQQAGDWLRTRAAEKKIDSFVDRELIRRIENGAEIACMEIPCLSDPDDAPPF